jgi:putative polyhydroxyalkanoate system protein
MADIDIRRLHDLGLKGARIAADRMAGELERKFGLKGDWAGNVLEFARPGLAGSFTVGEKDVRLTVTLGFLLKAMQGSIERAIESELDTLFAGPSPRPPPSSPAAPKKAPTSRKKGG